jgi:hypothetical protein
MQSDQGTYMDVQMDESNVCTRTRKKSALQLSQPKHYSLATSVINAQESWKVITNHIPGAFMHWDMDELIHMRLLLMAKLLA